VIDGSVQLCIASFTDLLPAGVTVTVFKNAAHSRADSISAHLVETSRSNAKLAVEATIEYEHGASFSGGTLRSIESL
jgi:hypothetical protein